MQLSLGNIIEGKVVKITNFGAFVDLGEEKSGMVHISEVSSKFVSEIKDHLTVFRYIYNLNLNHLTYSKVILNFANKLRRHF